MSDFWVFGYGSLMWRPGFAHVETQRATLSGYRRSLCVLSHVHRGTPQRPGLVLGLDRGGSCIGLAFRVPDDLKQEVVDYLRSRELVTHVYLERMLPLRLADGRRVMALAYVIDRAHEQYAGGLDVETAVGQISGATGVSGANEEYVTNTLDHLRGLGIRDAWLEAVGTALQKRP
ncbi:MAG: gamma-glutamylcyclotransferase [Mesorhizobium sp.]